jgi:hypothetical protein
MRLTMQALLAIGIIAILLAAGCADVKATQKVKDFGTTFGASAGQQKLIEWFKANYGDPTTNNNDPPRFVLPMVTTGTTQDNLPVDNIQVFPRDGGSVYFLVVYDNFKKGDPINVKWVYLANGNEVASVDQQAGDDFGRLIVEFQKPDSGWGVGKQEITVTGRGATAKVDFEIGAEKQTAPLPWEEAQAGGTSLAQEGARAGKGENSLAQAGRTSLAQEGARAGKEGTSLAQEGKSSLALTTCPEGQTLCSGSCVDLVSSSTNCGSCGSVCSGRLAHCKAGQCCTMEIERTGLMGGSQDVEHCPESPVTSTPTPVKACLYGATNCNGKCVQLDVDDRNCGSCGNSCEKMIPNGRQMGCSQGTCVLACNLGYLDCDKIFSNGCEVYMNKSDENSPNCGSCGNKCPPNQICWGGTKCCYRGYCGQTGY